MAENTYYTGDDKYQKFLSNKQHERDWKANSDDLKHPDWEPDPDSPGNLRKVSGLGEGSRKDFRLTGENDPNAVQIPQQSTQKNYYSGDDEHLKFLAASEHKQDWVDSQDALRHPDWEPNPDRPGQLRPVAGSNDYLRQFGFSQDQIDYGTPGNPLGRKGNYEDRPNKDTSKGRAEHKRALANETLAATEGALGELSNFVDENPGAADKEIEAYANSVRAAAKKAGVLDARFEQKIKTQLKGLQATETDARIRNNPEGALKHITENPGKYGKDVVKFKNRARKAVEKNLKEQKKLIQSEIIFQKADDIKKLGEQKGKVGDVARDTLFKLESDPHRATKEAFDYTPVNINDGASFADRAADVADAKESLGLDIPVLGNDEVRRITKRIEADPNAGLQFLNSLKGISPENGEPLLSREDKLGIARQFKDSGLGYLVASEGLDEDVVANVLRGMSLKSKVLDTGIPADSQYLNPASAEQARDAVHSYSKGEAEGEDSIANRDKYEKVMNIQRINGTLGFGGQSIPLPPGVDAGTFEAAAESVFSNADELERYTNGPIEGLRDSTGKAIDLDPSEVEWVAFSPGIYALKYNDRFLFTGDQMLKIDMGGLISGK